MHIIMRFRMACSHLYIQDQYIKTPKKLKVSPKKKGKMAVQIDELCAEVDNKGNKQWVWAERNVKTR